MTELLYTQVRQNPNNWRSKCPRGLARVLMDKCARPWRVKYSFLGMYMSLFSAWSLVPAAAPAQCLVGDYSSSVRSKFAVAPKFR